MRGGKLKRKLSSIKFFLFCFGMLVGCLRYFIKLFSTKQKDDNYSPAHFIKIRPFPELVSILHWGFFVLPSVRIFFFLSIIFPQISVLTGSFAEDKNTAQSECRLLFYLNECVSGCEFNKNWKEKKKLLWIYPYWVSIMNWCLSLYINPINRYEITPQEHINGHILCSFLSQCFCQFV